MSIPHPRQAGIIDIGSNSVRLVICDVLGASILQSFNEKVMAGLGEGLTKTGHLSPQGVEAALQALSRYRAILRALNVDTYQAVATAAVRMAGDGADFLKHAGKVLGRPVRLLSGEDEARLSARGVDLSIHNPQGLIGDLGGSSLEFMHIGHAGGSEAGESLMLGPLALGDVVNEPKELRKRIRETLKTSRALGEARGRFYAVGGAWRAFGRLVMEMERYPLHVLQGYQINQGQVARAAKLCVDSMTNAAARQQIEALDKRRARYFPVAAILMEEVLAQSTLEGVTISATGVREGVLHDLLDMKLEDPLTDGITAFARLDHNQIAFGRALHDFISPALVPQPDLFGSPAADIRIEKAACMMADSAGRYHPDHRAEMAYDQALRAPYLGVTHAERAMIAYAIGCRYEKDFRRPAEHAGLTTDAQADRARQIGLLMRLGAVFSGRSGPILKRVKLRREGDVLELEVGRRDANLISETVERRLSQAASQLKLKSRTSVR
ncbi:MAG: Ppx/GppA family phosphatase [Hyphomonas sp.]|uniref:Ppx/GppA family phosphatase n=1 Tax=Hyphomonas sp. TaxID=87 RepID=UPI0017A39666|nr:Ppx/GppA family phosphatase [Hyphomonas sp.]MBA3070076.1 Ppx/GppA family phosphatase [Hyphomonas sp.]MBU3921327.1 Ppx/GppA family phosphatase [Alphaproteobacteria bacterium]MBU4060348.1 Ppx/GppA family phosphatase [Alphaproteobacteria bacterium]MBU4163016.1 Ppx/GppA family phosphatase [Alphaproteobacteria bacterium]